MVFDNWVVEKFGKRGRREAAKFLGLSTNAIYSYCSLERFPSPINQEIIELKAGGDLDVKAWRSEYLRSRINIKGINHDLSALR